MAWEAGQSQAGFMETEALIVVDKDDQVVGAANKWECHRWVNLQPPRELLHRAFSVFLFNTKGELLLQQRASAKITFPDVWTNTCCSHPLHCPEEVDPVDNMGVKRAAVRKLHQELGIPVGTIAPDRFRFLTRVHYRAPYRPLGHPETEEPEWGEHEIDHLLVVQADVAVAPNPEEVRDVRYVDRDQLRTMMAPDSGLQWSPWFRKIVDRFYDDWTADLHTTLATDKWVDATTIHRL